MSWQTVFLAAALAAAALPQAKGDAAATALPAAPPTGTNLRRQSQLSKEKAVREDFAIKMEEETTPEPETTQEPTTPEPTPPADFNVLHIAQDIVGFFEHELSDSSHPRIVALGAFVIGLILVLHAKSAYHGLIIFLMGAVAMVLAMHFVGDLWALDVHHPLVITVGAEVAAVAAFSTYMGIQGMNIVVGVAFGFFMSFRLQMFAVWCGLKALETKTGNNWAIVIFYTVVMIAMGVAFIREGHLRVLAFFSPIIGGAFVASALAYGTTQLVASQYAAIKGVMPGLSPVTAPWSSFLQMLFVIRADDVGVFAGSKYNVTGPYTTDRIAGWVVWLIVVLIGWKLQKPFKRSRGTVRPAASASGRELQTPLLESED